jgi:hypothetical protein
VAENAMNLWKYLAIWHEPRAFCNPLSEAKVDESIELLALPDEVRVLDIACEKVESLVRTARRWKCGGVGDNAARVPSLSPIGCGLLIALLLSVGRIGLRRATGRATGPPLRGRG